jgi:hypothetical protein
VDGADTSVVKEVVTTMPLSRNAASEVARVILKHVQLDTLTVLLKDLTGTAAYRNNASFRESINHLHDTLIPPPKAGNSR